MEIVPEKNLSRMITKKLLRLQTNEMVNQTLEKMKIRSEDQLKTTPKEHQKTRLDLMINQQFFKIKSQRYTKHEDNLRAN